jgi:hypothetical protein
MQLQFSAELTERIKALMDSETLQDRAHKEYTRAHDRLDKAVQALGEHLDLPEGVDTIALPVGNGLLTVCKLTGDHPALYRHEWIKPCTRL